MRKVKTQIKAQLLEQGIKVQPTEFLITFAPRFTQGA